MSYGRRVAALKRSMKAWQLSTLQEKLSSTMAWYTSASLIQRARVVIRRGISLVLASSRKWRGRCWVLAQEQLLPPQAPQDRSCLIGKRLDAQTHTAQISTTRKVILFRLMGFMFINARFGRIQDSAGCSRLRMCSMEAWDGSVLADALELVSGLECTYP